MRLTPDVVSEAPQRLNCVGARELVLRDLAIPAVENLATARDGFDTIDLSSNAITSLGAECFPPFPRLAALYVGSNRIRAIHRGLADSLPNLRILVLTDNRIESIEDLNLEELARFKSLETLSLVGNPCAADPALKLLLVHVIPSLRFINFVRVTQADRRAAIDVHGLPETEAVKGKGKGKGNGKGKAKAKKRAAAEPSSLDEGGPASGRKAKKGKGPANGSEGAAPGNSGLSKEQIDKVKMAIASASSIDEVMALQSALQTGDVSAVLQLVQ